MNRQSPLTALKGIGEKTARVFAKAGIFTLEDLLEYYPRSYDSFQEPVMPSSLRDGQTAAVCGTIENGPMVPSEFHGCLSPLPLRIN